MLPHRRGRHDSEETVIHSRTTTAVLAVALLLTACSSDEDDPGVATLEGESTAEASAADGQADAGEDGEEAMLSFAQCMRDNGIEDFPDPTVGEDGTLQFAPPGGEDGPLGGDADELVRVAQEECGDILATLPVGPGGNTADDLTIETFVAFSECMREEGIEDFPDPGPDGLPDLQALQQLDTTAPAFQAAVDVCTDEVGFGGGLGGPGGG